MTAIPINLSQDLKSLRLEVMAAAFGVELWFTDHYVEKKVKKISTGVNLRPAGRGGRATASNRGAISNSRRGRKRNAAGESSLIPAKRQRRGVPRRMAAAKAMSKIGNKRPGKSLVLIVCRSGRIKSGLLMKLFRMNQ